MRDPRRKKGKGAQSGAAMIEYAVCFPIFIGIVVALLYIIRWFYTTSVLQYASYEAGRMLSQSEILAVPEVDYCGNGGSLSELDPSCVAFYNNLKAATDKADSILRTLLGGGAYSRLKTYKLYDRETYQQYGYTIPMGFPAIETKVLFLRPGEVAKDAEGNLVNHTNREPGQKVTSSTQCLNRTTGWPSPLCGNQKMQDIMRDKPFIVSAQVNESYSIPFLGKQTYPAIGTQVFYAAGSEVIEEIQKIETSTPTTTPTRTVTPRPPGQPDPPPPTEKDTPTPTPTPDQPTPIEYTIASTQSPCQYFQNWEQMCDVTKTQERYCPECTGERVCEDVVVCIPESYCIRERFKSVCKEYTWQDCGECGPLASCMKRGVMIFPTCEQKTVKECNDLPDGCDQWGVRDNCFLRRGGACKWVSTCADKWCTETIVDRQVIRFCKPAGQEPGNNCGSGSTLVQSSSVWYPYLACSCGGATCNTWCEGGTGISNCRGDYDCIYNPCWGPETGREPSCNLNINARCASQCN